MTISLRKGIRSLIQGSTPSSPPSGDRALYPKAGGWFDLDATGIEQRLAFQANLLGAVPSVYGHSFEDEAVMVPGQVPTSAGMWYSLVSAALSGGTPNNYSKGGQRILYGVSSLLNSGTWPGLSNASVSGSTWPGTSSRSGPVYFNYHTNDVAHTNGATSVPQPIAGTTGRRYVNGISALYEAAIAIASSESRKNVKTGVSGVTLTGTWTDSAAAYLSGGDFSQTNTNGDYATITGITPPQTGPYAGKVFVGFLTWDPTVLANATFTTQVDSLTAVAHPKVDWETIGATGNNVSYFVVPVDMPADSASHTLKITHTGTGSEYLCVDAIFIPSVTPGDMYVLEDPAPIIGSVYSAADIAVWKANNDILLPAIQKAVAKYPNAIWVPTSMQPGPLWVDGLHPDGNGMIARAADVTSAIVSRYLLGYPFAKRTTQIEVRVGRAVNSQTGTTYTFDLADANNVVDFSNTSAITATVPPNSAVPFPIGTEIEGVNLNTGDLTFVGGSGVTVSSAAGLNVRDQYGAYCLRKTAVNTWILFGRVTT